MYYQNEGYNQNFYMQNPYEFPYTPYFDPTIQFMNYYGVNQPNGQLLYPSQNYMTSYYPEYPIENDYGTEENVGQYVSPFIQYFQDENGELDIDKVFFTINQVMKTANQVGPIVQSVNNFVKNLR